MAYRELMSSCLNALDKYSDIHLVVVGETWRCLLDRIVLGVTVPEANSMCQDDHPFAKLKVVINGTVHGVQYIWDTKFTSIAIVVARLYYHMVCGA